MRISDNTFLAMVGASNTLTSEQIDALKKESDTSHDPLQILAKKHELLSDEALTKLFSDYTKIPYVEIDPKKIPEAALKKIPERIARQYNAIIFQIDADGLLHLAMEDPDDVEAISFLEKQIGTHIKIYVATRESIINGLDAYRIDVGKELGEVISIQADSNKNEAIREEDVAEDSPIAKTVNLLLEYAIRSGASDIHIEPREEYIQVRYRVDGVLKEVNRLPKNIANALVSRIKILSNLKIDERRVPQDGRFKIRLGGKQFAFRVSTLPITDGEKIVMRVLNESNDALPLDKLGYWGKSLSTINDALEEPNGMILVTGPTGSGKSTSLFSVLSRMNTPDVNISTIEDPVEYKIPGVNQTQTNVKAGMTFASGLRALLRQDPNIIMVGEIRDAETAETAIAAALTGHLVLSTL
ncbi:TPA: secretion system protein E, partial [Candidatus Saccharibacteria bacterium]|nr:secretion system protein E [Candidatus Saccharibacteria bacterium]